MSGEFKLRRGLKNVYAAEVTNDDNTATGYTTGTPFHLIPAGTMTRTPSADSSNTWFDDVVFSTVGTEGATEISIEGASLRADAVARLLGKDIDPTTGAVIDSGEYVEKYWAIGGEAEGIDGSSEFFWFLKGTFTAPEESDRTKDDGTDANGMTLTFNAIQTTHVFEGTGKVCKRVVIDNTVTQMQDGENWTGQVVTPDNLASICEALVAATGITVTPSTKSVVAGNTAALTATLAPTGARGTISWTTSNAAVATVNSSGVVTGVSAGSATITASSGSFSASCAVTVTAAQ